jgi:riboflavin kinase/FMN adenylyltransferase
MVAQVRIVANDPASPQDSRMASVTLDWTDCPPPAFTGGAVAVGNFDGVHLGHRALIAATARRASAVGGPTIAITFDPPPYQILFPNAPLRPPLTTISDRVERLHAEGATHVVVLRTSRELLQLSPEAFVRDLLVGRLGTRVIVEGYNFRFGHNRAGDTAFLRALCDQMEIGFEEVPPFVIGGEAVSSSRVRTALLTGAVSSATEWLGRPYQITGTVVSGARRGRTIGFPTANLGEVPTVLPANGVYAVRARVEGTTWPAAANVGPNPTFGDDAQKIEVHLIDFSGDLYGKSLAVEFIEKLRDTRPFASVNELITQLRADVEAASQILNRERSA